MAHSVESRWQAKEEGETLKVKMSVGPGFDNLRALLTPVFSARFSHCNKVPRAPLLPKGWRIGLPIDCSAFASSLVLLHYLRELPLVVGELLAVLCLLA